MPRRADTGSGFTLVELIIVVAILVAVAGIVVPNYLSSVETARVVKAVEEIRAISTDIEMFRNQNGDIPIDLAEIGRDTELDPWGRPYEYLNFDTVNGNAQKRKDKNLVPINTEYDLYSRGLDGDTTGALTAKMSHDDVIRADDGAFIGLAIKY